MTKQDIQVKSRFTLVRKKLGGASSFIAFAEAVRGTAFSRVAISRGFKTLVTKSDYAPEDEEALCEWLISSAQSDKGFEHAILTPVFVESSKTVFDPGARKCPEASPPPQSIPNRS